MDDVPLKKQTEHITVRCEVVCGFFHLKKKGKIWKGHVLPIENTTNLENKQTIIIFVALCKDYYCIIYVVLSPGWVCIALHLYSTVLNIKHNILFS